MLDRARKVFYDSNVLLYGVRGEARKVEIVRELVVLRGTVSVQVLNEIVNVCRKKFAMNPPEIETILRPLRSLVDIVPVTLGVHERGMELLERHDFSTYDAMIVAAALEAGCDRLYSEDMHHGLVVDGRLRIENPFRAV